MNDNPDQGTAPESELYRTKRPEVTAPDFVWEQDTLRNVGQWSIDSTKFQSYLNPYLKKSYKKSVIEFIDEGDYSNGVYQRTFRAIHQSKKLNPGGAFDESWLSNAIQKSTFGSLINPITNFFVHWQKIEPCVISDSVLQIMYQVKGLGAVGSNILSDDPEISWLTDSEYESVVAFIWRNYENEKLSVQSTLLYLISMQYARRPRQFAHLKMGDFRVELANDHSNSVGPVVAFPGVKDSNSQSDFRDSKFEVHPIPEHLWNLYELQRESVRQLFNTEFRLALSDSELDQLPVFTSIFRVRKAVSFLSGHYQLDWRKNLVNQQFHLTPVRISQYLRWQREDFQELKTPISHRTNRPIKLTATRMRHTRARQLARKGVALHVLSHWLGHTSEKSLKAYYNDPAEDARKLDKSMSPNLTPLAMAFAGTLIDTEDQASRYGDANSCLEFAADGNLKGVGHCGKHSFCSTTSVPVPCYRCRHFEPLVSAPHHEVLEALNLRQAEENESLHIGGARNLLIPIDLSADINAVQNCINRCEARKAELK